MKVKDLKNNLVNFYIYKNFYNEEDKLENLVLACSEGNSYLEKYLDSEVKQYKIISKNLIAVI